MLSLEFDSWWIETEAGERLTGRAAWTRLAGHFPASRLWRWLLRLRWIRRLSWAALTALVSQDPLARPDMVSVSETNPDCPPPHGRWLDRVEKVAVVGVLAALLTGIVWWNLDGLSSYGYGKAITAPIPDTLRTAVWYTGLWQFWDMFAPVPLQWDGWISIPGQFEDGSETDLVTGAPPTQNPQLFWFGPMARWEKYDENVSRNSYSALLSVWASYYCHLYNDIERRPNGARLATLEIHYYYRPSHAPGEPENAIVDNRLWRHWCYPQYQY